MKLFKKKPPFILAKTLTSLENTKSAKDYIGKKVYSTSGDKVGRVKNVVLKDDKLAGIIVQGKRLLFLDKEYCEPETVDAIILKVDPISLLKGKIVFDAAGKKLGKVINYERKDNKNNCNALIVKKHVFAKPLTIPYSEVDVSKKNIILNKEY